MFSPTQTLFYTQFTTSLHFIFVYLSIYIALDLYIGATENLEAYRHTPMHKNALNYQINMNLYVVFHTS